MSQKVGQIVEAKQNNDLHAIHEKDFIASDCSPTTINKSTSELLLGMVDASMVEFLQNPSKTSNCAPPMDSFRTVFRVFLKFFSVLEIEMEEVLNE